MWIRMVVVCVGLAGCGFTAASAPSGVNGNGPDAPPGSGSIDAPPGASRGSDGGTTPFNCLTAWMNHAVTLGDPIALSNQQSGNGDERDPWISKDGLRLYYTFQQTGPGKGNTTSTDIYLATRADNQPTTMFGEGTLQVNLSTSDNEESRPALTPDEKIFVMSTDRGSPQFNIVIATRSDTSQPFGTPDAMHMAKVNDPALGNHYDPFLSADGLRLYFSPTMPGQQHIVMSSRTDLNGDFSIPQPLTTITGTKNDADPALSLDEKIIVFSSDRAGGKGGNDLWYATRTDASLPFGAPQLVPNVNTSSADGDPMLSADGCTLYFSSTSGGSYDLYTATLTH